MLRVRERLTIVLPLTLFLIALLLYLNTKSAVKTGDRAARGAVLADRRGLAPLGCSATTSRSPSGSGMIALMGLDAETGVFMLLFLDLAYDERVRAGRMRTDGGPRGGDRPRRGQARAARS